MTKANKANAYRTTLARAPFSGDGHTILANAALRDRRLSWKARGVLGYLGSHALGWGVSEKQLANEAPEGLASLRSGLAELEEHGYMLRFRERLANGSLGDAMWVVSDNPATLEDYATELLMGLQAEGRRFVRMPTRTRKRGAKAKATAAPTFENRTLDTGRENSRSDPRCDFPTLSEPNQADRITKNTNTTREGEEGDARARVDGAAPDPSGVGAPGGVSGERECAATLAARDLVEELAREVLPRGESITGREWSELAVLVDHARPVVDAVAGLSWGEYQAYLRQGWWHSDGRRRFETFPAVLRARLSADHIRSRAVAWAAEQRVAQGDSGPRGGRERHAADDPFRGQAERAGTCGVHRVPTTERGCPECAAEARAEDARARGVDDDQEHGDGAGGERSPASVPGLEVVDAAQESAGVVVDDQEHDFNEDGGGVDSGEGAEVVPSVEELAAALESVPAVNKTGADRRHCGDDRCCADPASPRYRHRVVLVDGELVPRPCPVCLPDATAASAREGVA